MSILIIRNSNFYKTTAGSIAVGREFKNEQQFLWQFRTGTDLDAWNTISLVIYDGYLIYNKWDSEYELTYGTFYNWLQQNEINGYDEFYYIHNPLYEYLTNKCKRNRSFDKSGDTSVAKRYDEKATYDTLNNSTISRNGRIKADNPEGVTQDYATYYTIFRKNR